jgi:hypothetical protein
MASAVLLTLAPPAGSALVDLDHLGHTDDVDRETSTDGPVEAAAAAAPADGPPAKGSPRLPAATPSPSPSPAKSQPPNSPRFNVRDLPPARLPPAIGSEAPVSLAGLRTVTLARNADGLFGCFVHGGLEDNLFPSIDLRPGATVVVVDGEPFHHGDEIISINGEVRCALEEGRRACSRAPALTSMRDSMSWACRTTT